MTDIATLPPLRLVEKSLEAPNVGACVQLTVDVDGSSVALALGVAAPEEHQDDELARLFNFGEVLARHRAGASSRLVLHDEEPSVAPDAVAIPHVHAWRTSDDVRIAWEEMSPEDATTIFGVSLAVIERWARRSDDIVWLARSAPAPGDAVRGVYLSFRWIVRNETTVARLVSGRRTSFEHVSLHVEAAACPLVLDVFTRILGLVEVSRPASIATEGYWLQCGYVSVHLNTRPPRVDDVAFPGMAPNHVCFVVNDIVAAAEALAHVGLPTIEAGSLGNQLWFRLPGGSVVELQQRQQAEIDDQSVTAS